MAIRVLQASVADVARIAPLFDAYRVFYKQPSDLERAASFVEARLSRAESVVFLASNAQGEDVGFVQLFPSFSSVSTQRLWILNDLFVSPAARRHGVAKALMNRARDFAKTDGAKGLALETDADNVHGQALYESLGYVKGTSFHYFLSLQ
ncbi:Aste57867_9850 [Aphanomyces stellatus]|uniref:Aste57867_9850 protein n=1 Tax=Aphanomyces stellatus TaxID=120398 RepID=A0A485KNX2_9STRA|nr:hypothetical protein As57867_009811 [Aphanomyces stellatus]VFT86729.1 Aste57867_9850 [Aphanomyces stellatus]